MNEQQRPAPGRATNASAGSRRTAMRVVQDGDTVMLVYEVELGLMAEQPPALVFERTGGRRELSAFPQDWRRMSDAQLVGLLRNGRDD